MIDSGVLLSIGLVRVWVGIRYHVQTGWQHSYPEYFGFIFVQQEKMEHDEDQDGFIGHGVNSAMKCCGQEELVNSHTTPR